MSVCDLMQIFQPFHLRKKLSESLTNNTCINICYSVCYSSLTFSLHDFSIYMQGPDVCKVYNNGIYNVTLFTTCDCDDLRITVHNLSCSANVNPHKSEKSFFFFFFNQNTH